MGLLRTMGSSLVDLIVYESIRLVLLLLAAYGIGLGLLLLFGVGSPGIVARLFAPQPFGAFLFLHGSAKLVGLLLHIRVVVVPTAVLGAVVWGMLAIASLLGNAPPGGIMSYGLLSLFSFGCWLRIARGDSV